MYTILSKEAIHINQHYIAVSLEYYKTNKSEWSRSLPLNVILIPSLLSILAAHTDHTKLGATWDNQVCVWVDEGIPECTSNQRVHGSNLRECTTLLLLFFWEAGCGSAFDVWRRAERRARRGGGGVGLCGKLVIALHYNHFLMFYLISSCSVWQK